MVVSVGVCAAVGFGAARVGAAVSAAVAVGAGCVEADETSGDAMADGAAVGAAELEAHAASPNIIIAKSAANKSMDGRDMDSFWRTESVQLYA